MFYNLGDSSSLIGEWPCSLFQERSARIAYPLSRTRWTEGMSTHGYTCSVYLMTFTTKYSCNDKSIYIDIRMRFYYLIFFAIIIVFLLQVKVWIDTSFNVSIWVLRNCAQSERKVASTLDEWKQVLLYSTRKGSPSTSSIYNSKILPLCSSISE